MPRYFTRPKALYVADEPDWDSPASDWTPRVCEHEATDTGLIDVSGDTIMRAPNPVGFIWEE